MNAVVARVERKNSRRIKTYTQTWKAYSDSIDDDESVMSNYTGWPLDGQIHPSEVESPTPARVKTTSISREEEAIKEGGIPLWVWTNQVEFSNDAENSGVSPIYPDTLAKVGYGFDRMERVVEKDREDKPVVNTAKDPYDPPLTVEFPIPVKTINVNLSTSDFTPAMLTTYFMAINSDTYDGWAAGQVMVQDISATQEIWTDEEGNNVPYWSVTIKLAYNAFGWQPEILSRGYRQLNDEGNPEAIAPDGLQLTSPAILDEDGHAVYGDAVETDAHYTKYIIYNEVSLSGLNYATAA